MFNYDDYWLTVRPPSPPRVVGQYSYSYIGSNLRLYCGLTLREELVDGVTVKVVWTRPTNSTFSNVDDFYLYGTNYDSLSRVPNMTASDAGHYICTTSLTSSLPFVLSSDTSSSSVIATLKSK